MNTSNLAIVTGASRGLGKAIFQLLHTSNIPCITIARSPVPGNASMHIGADLSQPQDWSSRIQPLLSKVSFDHLTFFDNAALLPRGEVLAEGYETQLEEAIRVNLMAPVAIGRVLAAVAEKSGASLDIIHISSGAAYQAIPSWAAYCATKAAGAMQWQALAKEADFVTAHIFQPGVIDTDMQARLRTANDPVAPPQSALRAPEDVAADALRKYGLIR